MAKAKKGSSESPIILDDLKKAVNNIFTRDDRAFEITEASIKDDFCNYTYSVIGGIGIGDTHKVSGTGIIDDDLRNAMAKFNAHLAVIDEVFKHSGIEVEDIDMLHNHELTMLFHVTAFKIKGGKENESITLMGNKYVSSAGGRMEIKTPQISIDNASSYQWYNELKSAADAVREEVALYKLGKYTAVQEEVEESNPKQSKLNFSLTAISGSGDDAWDELENSKVK